MIKIAPLSKKLIQVQLSLWIALLQRILFSAVSDLKTIYFSMIKLTHQKKEASDGI